MSQSSEFSDALGAFFSWHGPATFFRCPVDPDPQHADVGVIGVPQTGGNMVERGQYLGPRAIRNTTMGYRRMHREWRVDPFSL